MEPPAAVMLIVDTDILIDAGRGQKAARQFIERAERQAHSQSLDVLVSAVTQMELLVGARNKLEQREIQKFLHRFKILPITERVSDTAVQLLVRYRLSHGLALPDALIAATALENSAHLATRNRKHFAFIEALLLVELPDGA